MLLVHVICMLFMLYSVEVRQATVKDLIEEDGVVRGVITTDAANKNIYAPLTLIADGCNSRFREKLGGSKPTAFSSFVGLILKMPYDSMPFPNHGHVILADPSPILLYAVSPTEVCAHFAAFVQWWVMFVCRCAF